MKKIKVRVWKQPNHPKPYLAHWQVPETTMEYWDRFGTLQEAREYVAKWDAEIYLVHDDGTERKMCRGIENSVVHSLCAHLNDFIEAKTGRKFDMEKHCYWYGYYVEWPVIDGEGNVVDMEYHISLENLHEACADLDIESPIGLTDALDQLTKGGV